MCSLTRHQTARISSCWNLTCGLQPNSSFSPSVWASLVYTWTCYTGRWPLNKLDQWVCWLSLTCSLSLASSNHAQEKLGAQLPSVTSCTKVVLMKLLLPSHIISCTPYWIHGINQTSAKPHLESVTGVGFIITGIILKALN